MSGIVEQLHALESRPGVLTATLSMGFPFADIRDAGASVLVATDGDRQLAEQCADEFAGYLWERRAELVSDLVSVEEAIARSRAGEGKPFVLAEGSDNPGGGGPCDGTHVLRAFLEAGVSGAVIAIIADPESVDLAFRAGPGNRVALRIGGKTDPLPRGAGGGDGARQADLRRPLRPQGPMGRGKSGSLGRTAAVEAGRGHRPADRGAGAAVRRRGAALERDLRRRTAS